jgi:ABC-type multidrug transport system ATPase subunit
MTLTAENLCKRYNREWIFRNLNYTFREGHYAIIGPNGSGKSTLLQVLWGQLPGSVGKLTYEEADHPVPAEAIYRYLTIAAPYVDLIEELTLKEILHFHFSFKTARGRQSPEELMDRMELTHARDKQVGHFSSGMKQRLKLGLALFSDVPLIFLDEPTTNLDKPATAWYWEQFNSLPPKTTVFIGSNHESEYPVQAIRINLSDYKTGY